MDDATVVPSLVTGYPGLLFENRDPNAFLFSDDLKAGGEANNTATNNDDVKIHAVSVPQQVSSFATGF